MADFLEGTIKKQEAAAEHAGNVINENIALQEKIQEGLNRLEQAISEAKSAIDIADGNIIGSWTAAFIHGEFELKGQIQGWEIEINSYRGFLKRTPEIRQELERQLLGCTSQIESSKTVQNQSEMVRSYCELKEKLREDFSDQQLFGLADLERKISEFEPDIFEADFAPFLAGLRDQHRGRSRLLKIPRPNTGDQSSVEIFWQFWNYEAHRHEMLSKPFRGEMANVLPKMRLLSVNVRGIDGGELVRDFNDVFFPALQAKNPTNSRIMELR